MNFSNSPRKLKTFDLMAFLFFSFHRLQSSNGGRWVWWLQTPSAHLPRWWLWLVII